MAKLISQLKGATPDYLDSDGTHHSINEIKIVGGGVSKWYSDISRDSPLGWEEASWATSPTRSVTAPFEMTNIDDVEFDSVPQCEVTFPLMSYDDFIDLQNVLHQRYCYVTFFNVYRGTWMTREMAITGNERGNIYNRGTTIMGIQQVKVTFVSTQRGIAGSGSGGGGGSSEGAYIISYSANGGTGSIPSVECDAGEQYQIESPYGIMEKPRSAFKYWATHSDGTGEIFYANQYITVFKSYSLYAIWQDI